MARLANRNEFKTYVLSKLGSPILDLVIQTNVLDDCVTPGTTGTTGTTGTSGVDNTTITFDTVAGSASPSCQAFASSIATQLDFAIDDTLDYFQNHASNLGNEKGILFIQLIKGKTYYDVPPCIMSVEQDVRKGSSFQFDSEEANEGVGLFSIQSQFGPRGVFSYLGAGTEDTLLTYEIAWQYNQLVDLRYTVKFQTEFNELEHRIYILPTPDKNDINRVIAYGCNIKVPDEKCFNSLWVQRYAVALTMEQIGRNLSMYTGMQLPGGGDFNSSFYWDMGREEKDKLEEELLTGKWGSNPGSFFLTG